MTAVQHGEHLIGRVLPVVVLEDARAAGPLADAITAGGLHAVEVTFRTRAAAEVIAEMAARPDLVVGAGTVLTREQVDAAVSAGARFVVSPGFDRDVVRHCRDRDIRAYPGVATATEIQMALGEGLDTLKFFPAGQLGGPSMIKALSAPFRNVRFIPTGGVNAGNLANYLAIPSVLAVGGSWMVEPDLLAAGDWAEVTKRTAAAVEVAR